MEIESLTKCRRMQIAYELTQQDFIEAYSVHRTRNKFSKWTWLFFKWMVGFMTVISLLALAIEHNEETTKNLLPFLGLLIFWWLRLVLAASRCENALRRFYVCREEFLPPTAIARLGGT